MKLALASRCSPLPSWRRPGCRRRTPRRRSTSIPCRIADAARRHLSRRSRRRGDQFARRHLCLHAHRPSDDVARHRASLRARRLAAVPVRSQRANSCARSARTSTGFCSPRRSASIRRTTSGSSTRCRTMVMKFDPQGRVAMLLGRKAESIPESGRGRRRRRRRRWRRRRGAAARSRRAAGPLQPADRRRVGRAGQYLRRRRPRQRARRQILRTASS